MDKKLEVRKDRSLGFVDWQFYYNCLFYRNIYRADEYYRIYIPEHPFASFNGYNYNDLSEKMGSNCINYAQAYGKVG